MTSTYFISHPVKSIQGEITVPGDKSISHRSLILGSIAKGATTVSGFLEGEDCLATLKAFEAMGVTIERPSAEKLVIHGVGKHGLKQPDSVIDCGNSGTSMRLLAGLLSPQRFNTTLTGDSSLIKRPMERISIPLAQMGADITTTMGKPPLVIKGNQNLQGISYTMPLASAQVKSCLLLAGMYAANETQIIEPHATRDHTEKMLMAFSYPLKRKNNEIIINSNGECRGTFINIPADISSAAFFIVAASIIPKSNLTIKQVGINPTRTGIIDILTRMGAQIKLENKQIIGEEPIADIVIKSSALKGITIPTKLVPLAIDEFPIIFIAAACAKGETTLSGASELRSKESDRIGAMVLGLRQLGIETFDTPDGISIAGGKISGGIVDSFDDHRIAMAFAIAGAVADSQVTIKNCANVATSFPNFIKIANSVQLAIEETCHENR